MGAGLILRFFVGAHWAYAVWAVGTLVLLITLWLLAWMALPILKIYLDFLTVGPTMFRKLRFARDMISPLSQQDREALQDFASRISKL